MNYSHKNKILWFTPIRTASRACVPIMEYFNFDSTKYHDENFPKDSDDYVLITNVHNPYKRLVSIFKMFEEQKNLSNVSFHDWIHTNLKNLNKHNQNPHQLWISKFILSFKKKPDYIVRVENIEEDLLKIKFIQENMSKELKKIFSENIKTNQYREDNFDYWKKEYDENLSNYVFDNFRNDFELFGYDKNSWK